MKLTFTLFALVIVGLLATVFILAWMLKKAIQHTNKSEEPETLVTPKRYVATPDEEDRMRE